MAGVEALKWIRTAEPRQLTLVGNCPRCKHPISDHEEQLTPPDTNKPLPTVVIACNCLAKHEGRPDDVTRGCGQASVFEHPTGPGSVKAPEKPVPYVDPDQFVSEYLRHRAQETDVNWDSRPDPSWAEHLAYLEWEQTDPEEIPDAWVKFVDEWRHGKPSKPLTIVGICPRCGHPISDREEKTTREKTVLIACNCLGRHEGRPSEVVRGCGQAVFSSTRKARGR